jgi:hypothetical protein
MSLEPVTNFKDSNGVDLGTKLVTKDYLITVYPGIADKIGIPPELWTWGFGVSGKLGNGVITGYISTPVTTFSGGTNWKQVSAGNDHMAAIKTDGTLWTWGEGSALLGNGITIGDISTPVTTFAGGSNWKQVSAGSEHTAAIKTDGTLWSWGTASRVGNGVVSGFAITPVTTFAGGINWKQVSGGEFHTAAIKTDGTLWLWGTGYNGQLGNGVTTTIFGYISTPVTTFAGGTNWKQVSAGSGNTAAIKTDGTLWIWGGTTDGKLGNAVITANISTPITTFAGGSNWKQVSAGSQHTAAIKTDGTLWTWGYGGRGILGNGVVLGVTDISTPITTFAGGTNWKQVSGGSLTTAIKTDGTLWIWGHALAGRLGNGITTGDRSTPITTFAGGTDWKQVSGGSDFAAAIKSVDFTPF